MEIRNLKHCVVIDSAALIMHALLSMSSLSDKHVNTHASVKRKRIVHKTLFVVVWLCQNPHESVKRNLIGNKTILNIFVFIVRTNIWKKTAA